MSHVYQKILKYNFIMPTTNAASAQNFVPIKDIREGVIILKSGGYRGVLMCSSINFELKSSDEQNAIINGFQTFLNTLDFSIQIVVQSRKIDIRPYLALLEEKKKEEQTELLRIQLREYMSFIKTFTENTSIMTKSFYIVVPYSQNSTKAAQHLFSGFISHNKDNQDEQVTGSEEIFREARAQLQERMALVASSISTTGVRAIALGTEELIELFFRSFNPGEIEDPIRLS